MRTALCVCKRPASVLAAVAVFALCVSAYGQDISLRPIKAVTGAYTHVPGPYPPAPPQATPLEIKIPAGGVEVECEL